MLVHPLLFCMSEAYSLPLRARLSYWHQSLIAPDIGFPCVFYLHPVPVRRVCKTYTLFSCRVFVGSRGSTVRQSSHDFVLYFLCPYKVPSGSELPTRDMAYHRAYINVAMLPGLCLSTLLRDFFQVGKRSHQYHTVVREGYSSDTARLHCHGARKMLIRMRCLCILRLTLLLDLGLVYY